MQNLVKKSIILKHCLFAYFLIMCNGSYALVDTLEFQQGLNNYSGTFDTWVDSGYPNDTYGNSDVIWVDDDASDSVFDDYPGQGLVAFSSIFSNPKNPIPNTIPLGSEIISATLEVTLADDIDSPIFDPAIEVWTMTRAWNEGSTWNSLSGGCQDDAGTYLDFFYGDNDPDFEWTRTIDVTEALSEWSDGSPNYGFAFFSEVIDWNDDGIELWSSEHSNISERPKLVVSFNAPKPPKPKPNNSDVNGDGTVNISDMLAIVALFGSSDPSADVNSDGTVNILDLLDVMTNFDD